MPNVLLFPPDFPNISTQSELEDAVTRLRTEAVNTARRQSHTRRIGGQQAIENQNRAVLAIPILMPFDQIGQQAPPITPAPAPTAPTTVAPPVPPAPAAPPAPPAGDPPTPPAVQPAAVTIAQNGTPRIVGTVGVFGGSTKIKNPTAPRRFMQELSLIQETTNRLGTQLTQDRNYRATTGNLARGLFCGGDNDSVTIDIYNYGRKSIRRAGVKLSVARYGATGNIQNPQKGVLVGGAITKTSSARDLQRITFSDPLVIARVANFLPSPRFSPHGAMCSPSYGYVYSGSASAHTGAPLNTILEIYHLPATETVATLGATIASRFHVVHAAFGHADAGFVAAGSHANPIQSNWFSEQITKLPFQTKIPSTLATTLAQPKTCADGTGSNLAGYTVGGHIGSIGNHTNTIDRLAYAPTPEQNRRIGTQLTTSQEDQGSISDYGPGFSR